MIIWYVLLFPPLPSDLYPVQLPHVPMLCLSHRLLNALPAWLRHITILTLLLTAGPLLPKFWLSFTLLHLCLYKRQAGSIPFAGIDGSITRAFLPSRLGPLVSA